MSDMMPHNSAFHKATSDGLQSIFQKELEAIRRQESIVAQAALGQANRAVKRRQDMTTLYHQADTKEKELQTAKAELHAMKQTLETENEEVKGATERRNAAKARVETLREGM
ncbi:hypothetical protein FRB94_001509 [Tulasnella sp. JGI-2019a]|nr:hypothetical protein FRB94_001509 [Tulasnella sp. JGI-2019a]KAG9007013.1 hypothetical protein FRB93_008280 [Tulasnella sp. JGI-2019a]KAG9034232.1 hypothetical protein FRB95_013513 [Tulasnella sp. JGI-2019a]